MMHANLRGCYATLNGHQDIQSCEKQLWVIFLWSYLEKKRRKEVICLQPSLHSPLLSCPCLTLSASLQTTSCTESKRLDGGLQRVWPNSQKVWPELQNPAQCNVSLCFYTSLATLACHYCFVDRLVIYFQVVPSQMFGKASQLFSGLWGATLAWIRRRRAETSSLGLFCCL